MAAGIRGQWTPEGGAWRWESEGVTEPLHTSLSLKQPGDTKPRSSVDVGIWEGDINLQKNIDAESRTRSSTMETWWSVSRSGSEARAHSPVSVRSDNSAIIVGLDGRKCDEDAKDQDGPSPEVDVLDASENGASVSAPEDSWILLNDQNGTVAGVAVQPEVPSVSGDTVESEWLTEGSSVAASKSSSGVSARPQAVDHTAKNASWAHPWRDVNAASGDLSAPSHALAVGSAPMEVSYQSAEAMQQALSDCELQLNYLEKQDAVNCGSSQGQAREAACSELCGQLISLAADALECGFRRTVPAAMEVYEKSNAALDRVAALLKRENDSQTSTDTVNPRPSDDPSCGCLDGLRNLILALK